LTVAFRDTEGVKETERDADAVAEAVAEDVGTLVAPTDFVEVADDVLEEVPEAVNVLRDVPEPVAVLMAVYLQCVCARARVCVCVCVWGGGEGGLVAVRLQSGWSLCQEGCC
jgi:hypothetical protein